MGHSKHIDVSKSGDLIASLIGRYSDIITSTMGPGGAVILIQSTFGAMATKDGVTVSRHIAPRGSLDQLIARMIIDAANRTVKEVGDGTTTTVCLLSAIYGLWNETYKNGGFDKRDFLSGMDGAVKDIIDHLEGSSRKIVGDSGNIDKDALRHVAMIACNGDENIAGMVSDLVYDVGIHGRVTIKRNLGHTTYCDRLPGYTFDTVLLGRQHLKDKMEGEVVLENPLFIMNADHFEHDMEIIPVIDAWLSSNELRGENGNIRPLVIVTTGLTGGARSFISANAEKHPVYVVQPPFGGNQGWDIMSDLADMTQTHQVYLTSRGKPIKDSFGQDFMEDEMDADETWKEFGSARRCIVSLNQCSIVPNSDYDSVYRIRVLEREIKDSKKEGEIAFLEQRIAALSSGIGVVYVGADSDTEAHRIEHAVDDTSQACFTALKGGVVPGAGRAYWSALHQLSKFRNEMVQGTRVMDSYYSGYSMVLLAAGIPAYYVIGNYTGKDKTTVMGDISQLLHLHPKLGKDLWMGWDARGELIGDMFTEGIIDPTLVCISALKNAVSVAKQLIHAKYALVEDKVESVVGQVSEDEKLPDQIDKESIRELYRRLDLLKVNNVV